MFCGSGKSSMTVLQMLIAAAQGVDPPSLPAQVWSTDMMPLRFLEFMQSLHFTERSEQKQNCISS